MDNYETKYLFPFLLGEVQELDVSEFDSYDHGIKFSTSYPRKLIADEWLYRTSERLATYTQGKAYLDELINPSQQFVIKGYPNGALYSFLVIIEDRKYQFYYDPSSHQKFHRY